MYTKTETFEKTIFENFHILENISLLGGFNILSSFVLDLGLIGGEELPIALSNARPGNLNSDATSLGGVSGTSAFKEEE